MFKLMVGTTANGSETISVVDDNGLVRADVMVEIYEDVPRLVITYGIEERGSDDANFVMDLLTGELVQA